MWLQWVVVSIIALAIADRVGAQAVIPTFKMLESAVFSRLISLALAGVGLTSFVMLIIGGYQFLFAGSEKEKNQKAANTISYAIGGLVLTVSAWVVLNFVGNIVGVDFSVFNICIPGQVCT